MKRIVILICIIAVAMTSVHAQEFIGFQVGFAQSTTRLNDLSTFASKKELKASNYNGFKIGVVYDATLIKGFGVSMGLNYTFGANATEWTKKVSTQVPDYPQVRSLGQYHQLEIPVDWQYKFEIAQRTWLILYTGPTLQCGLSFNEKWQLRLSPDQSNDLSENNLYSAEDMKGKNLKRINVTWGVGAGFQYERYFLRGGYDFGLINPYKEQTINDINTRGHFDQWQIKLGMYFWER